MLHFLFLLLLPIPIISMEEELFTRKGETESLIHGGAPDRLFMHDAAKNPIIYNKSREFYDEESEKTFLKKAYCTSILTITRDVLCIGGCFGATGGSATSGIMIGCCSQSLYQSLGIGGLFACTIGTICMAGGAGALAYHSCDECKKIKKEMMHLQQGLRWDKPLEISDEMLVAADPKKKIALPIEEIEEIRKSVKRYKQLDVWSQMKRFVDSHSVWKDHELEIHRKIRARRDVLQRTSYEARKNPRIRILLRDMLKNKGLPAPIISMIFKKIGTEEFQRIYELEKSYITEKELVTLLRNCNKINDSHVCKIYAVQALLAQKGWFSFRPTEKYPIKCEMRYFTKDTNYVSRYGQTIYLPYSPELIKYYKFDEDPAYAGANNYAEKSLLLENELQSYDSIKL